MRGKDKVACWNSQMLDDFRRVPVREEAVRAEVFVYLDEMQFALGFLAGSGSARFAIANDPASRGDPSRIKEGPESQNYRGRIAAGIGDQFRVAHGLAI